MADLDLASGLAFPSKECPIPVDFFDPDTRSLVTAGEMVKLFTTRRGVKAEELLLPPIAMVTFSRRILNALVRMAGAARCESWRGRNPRLFRATVEGRPFVMTRSPYGAPGAAILLEELIAFGVRRVVFLGYCGSIQDRMDIGDVVLPTGSLREEGTSYHYRPRGAECRPDGELLDSLHRCLKERGVVVARGTVWTTDALYRETAKKIEKYRREGVLAVEMEISALFAVGMMRRVQVVALLLVSDQFSREGWTVGFFHPRLLERERLIAQMMIAWLSCQP
jgi:uridine phosphorylase